MQEAPSRSGGLDERLFHAVNANGSPAGDRFFSSITELGSIWASAGAALALVARGHRRAAVDAFGAAGATWLAGQALKRAFDRPRPYEALDDLRLLIHRPRGSSWPSSHPAVLLAFLLVAGRHLELAKGVRTALAGLAVAVGLSRVRLGVHYPGDVVGGLAMGWGVAEAWRALASPVLNGTASSGAAPR